MYQMQEKNDAAARGDARIEECARTQESLRLQLISLSTTLRETLAQRDALLERVARMERLVSQCIAQTPNAILSSLRSLLADDSEAIADAMLALVRKAANEDG